MGGWKRGAHYCIARSKIKFSPDSKQSLERVDRSKGVRMYLRGRKRYKFSRTIGVNENQSGLAERVR